MKNIFGWLIELLKEWVSELWSKTYVKKELNIEVIADYCTITKSENTVYEFDTRLKKNFCIIKRV